MSSKLKKKAKNFFDEEDLEQKLTHKKPGRKFNRMLFHGSGIHSVIMYEALKERLDYGHMILSGLQQGVRINTAEYKEGEQEIKDVIRDILASFGYYDTGLKYRKTPYLKLKKI